MARWRSIKRPPKHSRNIWINTESGKYLGMYGLASGTFYILTSNKSETAKMAKGVLGWREA